MNFKRIKTTAAAGILAASMILPNMTAFAATQDSETGAVSTPQIEKTIEKDENVTSIPDADKTITFHVAQTDNVSGSARPSEVAAYDVTINANETLTTDILTSSIIDSLTYGEYSFEITETTEASGSDFGWTTVDSTSAGTYYLRVVVKSDGTPSYFITKTNGDTTVGNKLDSVDYTNVYNKKSVDEGGNANSLTVTKTIDEDDAAYQDPNATYPITVTFTVPDEQITLTDASYTISENATRTPGADGKTVTVTANLKKDESFTISNIAVGATYTVSEDTSNLGSNFVDEDYTVVEGTTQLQNKGTDCTGMTFKNASQNVTVHNDFNNITITGVVTDVAPYVTLVVVAVAAIAAYVIMKRRIAR